jgi:hypothetical protein
MYLFVKSIATSSFKPQIAQKTKPNPIHPPHLSIIPPIKRYATSFGDVATPGNFGAVSRLGDVVPPSDGEVERFACVYCYSYWR